jgi:hypothetical protein
MQSFAATFADDGDGCRVMLGDPKNVLPRDRVVTSCHFPDFEMRFFITLKKQAHRRKT